MTTKTSDKLINTNRVAVAVAGAEVVVAGVAVEDEALPEGEPPGAILAPATCPTD